MRGLTRLRALRQRFRRGEAGAAPPASPADPPAGDPLAGNPLAFWSGPPVALLHIEKTAGTALALALCAQCHPTQIYTDPALGEAQRAGAAAPAPPANLADCKLIWGHYDLPGLLRLAPGRRVITLLRDPQARVLSLYSFWRSFQPDSREALADPRVRLAQELDLLAFLQCRHPAVHDSIDNAYVRRLASLNAGEFLQDRVEADPEGSLALAMAALDDLACAGVVERMAETLSALSRVLGVRLAEALPQANVGAQNAVANPAAFRAVAREPLTPESAAALRERTSLDQVIYDECCGRLTRGSQQSQPGVGPFASRTT